MSKQQPSFIRLHGVRQNNLKGFDLDIPLGKWTVVTGLSGAGKSSLVFDTLHAEGQRRYVETFSSYTRQFLELLDKPRIDSVENIRPSIAIQQSNTVKTSRSTVGTMTELCDYFKVWFSHVARLHDPETGEIIEDDNPRTIWEKVLHHYRDREIMLTFAVKRPDKLKESEILNSLAGQGFNRIAIGSKLLRIDEIRENPPPFDSLLVIADRLRVEPEQQNRFIDAAQQCLHFGDGVMQVLLPQKENASRQSGATVPWEVITYSSGLCSTTTGRRFRPATPGLFSFNSPLGACPRCRGFGRVIEIDYKLVIPDESLSIEAGAIRPFQGEIYGESLRDLLKAAKHHRIPTNKPWKDMSEQEKAFVLEGEPGYGENGKEWPNAWYGVRRFFDWLEENTYKMHVRIFLSKYRAYTECPDCRGNRLIPEALYWKWNGYTLPELYRLPVGELLEILKQAAGRHRVSSHDTPEKHQAAIAFDSILTRLHYLKQVGLEYLTLDRPSRTLSGGETMRVSLTSCLGTSLVDTLFVLDEPSIGLHSRDINRLISILRRLTDLGNTVVVVEHDEAIMRAADHLIEVGPEPGMRGGHITFSGSVREAMRNRHCLTGQYLSGKKQIPVPTSRRPVTLPRSGSKKQSANPPFLRIRGASCHNIRNLDLDLPLQRFVCLSGVSGSGKSTLLDNVLFQGFQRQRNLHTESPASIREWLCDTELNQVVLVDQSPVSKTPRSNPVLYCDAWDDIRNLFATSDAARSAGFTASHFSFNSGEGRCEHCQGLGYERVEMQFLSDVFITCPHCEGKRFKDEILAIEVMGKSVADILNMDVSTAMEFFQKQPRIRRKLSFLNDVGLGYLTLGQPLNTLSGGESQRLKLVKYLAQIDPETAGTLLLLDEPSTGLHRDDISRLIQVLQRLIDLGHSLVVIEHNMDILKSADWIIEMGPEAGEQGGRIIFSGPPEKLASANSPTAPFIKATLAESGNGTVPWEELAAVAESHAEFNGSGRDAGKTQALQIIGAREHNLKNISLEIPHSKLSVITGVSGSGKSSLAFDIVFAEGQRRFMESMSAYARQFVEQMPRPDIDGLYGIAPTVAIEQRVTRGSRKSTVATITEVAQYLRLLFSRVGIQHSPVTGEPLVAMSESQLQKLLRKTLETPAAKNAKNLYLCAPVIRGRKGHHQPLANWAADHGYGLLRVDGKWIPSANFQRLDRYREHDIDLVISDLKYNRSKDRSTLRTKGDWPKPDEALREALKRGHGNAFLMDGTGKTLAWFSTSRTDPATGESYPELDPKHFSWNSPKGWCPTCRGYGRLYSWMTDDENFQEVEDSVEDGQICPDCRDERLNPVSRAVFIPLESTGRSKQSSKLNLPGLLRLSSAELMDTLKRLKLDSRGRQIARDILPQIAERLQFMDEVGLGYLTMDRATITLSGGEAQRIRLAAQLGSQLSGVLYVLDEPSIGLHARDNAKLIESLHSLRDKGNTLLVVEHDDDTMRAADNIIDLGPGAGIHGGRLLAQGHYRSILNNPESLTGRYLKEGIPHPLRGSYRPLPSPWNPRKPEKDWIVLQKPTLRNLKGDDLHLPVGKLIIFCGISGAGKSTLIRDLLRPAVEQAIKLKKDRLPGESLPSLCDSGKPVFKQLINGNLFRHVIEVDQEPIGKTPRSTPATYIGAFDIIRDFFASLPESKIHGYRSGYFSFNTKGGRCETCLGAGRIKLEMNFLPDSYLPCEDCGGGRYGPELKEIRWKGKNISEVLAMSFEEAAAFFDFHSKLRDMLNLMVETGLGYLTLGQSSPTLSGGEAQRLKLVSELAKGLPSFREKSRNVEVRNLYLLEEPTIGLHLRDCQQLIELLHRLVDQGHTVVVIEHNLDVIVEADYLVEIGPEGGEAGGQILYQGPLHGILKVKKSPTAPFLKDKLKG